VCLGMGGREGHPPCSQFGKQKLYSIAAPVPTVTQACRSAKFLLTCIIHTGLACCNANTLGLAGAARHWSLNARPEEQS